MEDEKVEEEDNNKEESSKGRSVAEGGSIALTGINKGVYENV